MTIPLMYWIRNCFLLCLFVFHLSIQATFIRSISNYLKACLKFDRNKSWRNMKTRWFNIIQAYRQIFALSSSSFSWPEPRVKWLRIENCFLWMKSFYSVKFMASSINIWIGNFDNWRFERNGKTKKRGKRNYEGFWKLIWSQRSFNKLLKLLFRKESRLTVSNEREEKRSQKSILPTNFQDERRVEIEMGSKIHWYANKYRYETSINHSIVRENSKTWRRNCWFFEFITNHVTLKTLLFRLFALED